MHDNSKSIKDLNRRPQTVKLREESTGTKVQNIGFDKDFMHMILKAPSNRKQQEQQKQLSRTTANKKAVAKQKK